MLNFSPLALLLGHFHAPGVPCFPAAPVARGEAKRPIVIFSHGLGGNRSMYAEHGAAYAAQVSGEDWWVQRYLEKEREIEREMTLLDSSAVLLSPRAIIFASVSRS